MKKIKSFLNSDFYPFIVAVIGFITWALPKELLWLNNALVIVFLLAFIIILTLFKNTKYVIPIVLSLLFMINLQKIGVDDLEGIGIFHVVAVLAVTGLVIHFIKYKHKFKFDWIAFGLLLIAITYIIPMFYMPFTGLLFSISMSGLIYVLLYLFFRSTAEITTTEVLTYFFYASLQLITIMLYTMGTGFFELIQSNSILETFKIGLKTSWGKGDYGFGNINDLIIHLTILSSGVFYKIIKNPKNYTYWLLILLGVLVVLLSGSRGGFISLVLVLFAYLIVLVVYGEKHQIIFASILVISFGSIIYLKNDLAVIFYNNFINGRIDDLDAFSSGRIKLYKDAFKVFKEYPLFGAGWTYTFESGNLNRIQIYHSTIFQTMAISGIAGLVAVFIFTVSCFAKLLKKASLHVLILGIPWAAAMIHGLIDNTIHMVIFTVLTIIMFTGIASVKTNVKDIKKNHFEILIKDKLY